MMASLHMQAQSLMSLPIPGTDFNAGPTFEFVADDFCILTNQNQKVFSVKGMKVKRENGKNGVQQV